ncbi:MAG: hypothetical protein WDZ77_00320 [Candidatus Pacearchaeota archaeon]
MKGKKLKIFSHHFSKTWGEVKDKKGFLQISFAWLFGIIVGGFILFLAIYASTKIIDVQETKIDAQTSEEIGVLLNPLETGFETGRTSSINFPSETRIHNRCSNESYFGKQTIKVSQKIFDDWTETDIEANFRNKHIFSKGNVEGKKFLLFSKPFEFPYKVADVIYLTSSETNYCFMDAPEEIEEELENLGQENIFIGGNCPDLSLKVCFSSGINCDIEVNYGKSGEVQKSGETLYFYEDSLMYGAIFSEPEIYECQTERLIQRAAELNDLYLEKSNFLSINGPQCSNNIGQDLLDLKNIENSFDHSSDLNALIISLVRQIDIKNDLQECELW